MSVNQDSHTVGEWIREHCLQPRALTVGAAADLLGIARPTLSKILNGRMELSAAVAARMETVFAVDAKALLEKQLQTSDSQAQTAAVSEQVRCYVPRFLEVRAGDLVHWADTLDARARLSVLLRRLVHSTGTALRTVDFPGNDDSQRPGWDGWVETNVGTPWIPEGRSGWEFGTTEEIGQKANKDFKKSLEQHSESERQTIVFVFVTPLRWTGKNAWLKEKKALNEWRDVRAYDAVDLEQWLEQSLPAQTWLMQELGQPTQNVRTLERCWDNWSVVTEPPMVPTFFEAAVEDHREKWQTWLNDTVSKKPFVIEADTADMGLAFFCCLAKTVPDATNRILVFDKPGVLPSLVQGTVDFLAVVHSPDVERELASVRDKVRAVVIYPRSQRHMDGAVVLEETTVSMFDAGLKAMALGAERCRILAIETGGSLTVLRRRLAVNQVMKQPVWAETGSEKGRLMAAAALLGTWDKRADADTLAAVSGMETEAVERCWGQLRLLEDTPVWEIGGVRGVTSKMDVFFAAAANADEAMLRRFYDSVVTVFSEKDPAWGLTAEEKWQRSYEVHDRPRFSDVLRRGLADTLVFLSVYGKTLFGHWSDFDGGKEAAAVIRRILVPMSAEHWETNNRWLPFFAEAAPEFFLALCEDDVRQSASVLKQMMRPAENAFFAPCPRSGLLWALEGAAWEKTTFARAVLILAQLDKWATEDNYGNTPRHSLQGLFRRWMPQTLADADTRLTVLKQLLKTHSKVGWDLCLLQLRRDDIGTYNHKPRWRRRATEYGEPQAVARTLMVQVVQIVLSQPAYSAEQLRDLAKLMPRLDTKQNLQVITLIDAWYQQGQTWQDVEKVREVLRSTVILDRAAPATLRSAAEKWYAQTISVDPVRRNLWLFEDSWSVKLETTTDDDSADTYQAQEKRLLAARLKAIEEIRSARGEAGILQMAEEAASPRDVGYTLAFVENENVHVVDFVTAIFRRPVGKAVVSALLWVLREKLPSVLRALRGRLSENEFATLLLWAPCEPAVWSAAECSPSCSDTYWKNVEPSVVTDGNAEEAVRRLMKAGRSWTAFRVVNYRFKAVDVRLLVDLLWQMGQSLPESPEEVKDGDIRRCFEIVEASEAVTDDEKVRLEFLFVWALGVRYVGDVSVIPYLDRYVSEHPELFVQALTWVFGRDDGKADDKPLPEPEQKAKWRQGYALLGALRRLPGSEAATAEGREAQLQAWIQASQAQAEVVGRRRMADKCIGNLLARSAEEDGVWPPVAVCAVLEEFRSDEMAKGVYFERMNRFGAHWVDEKGTASLKEATKYRVWADQRVVEYPFTAVNVLIPLAESFEAQAKRERESLQAERKAWQ